jgi:multiple sugar transport system permease protein
MRNAGKLPGRILLHLLIVVIAAVFLFPLYWMVSTAFKANDVLLKVPPEWFPRHPLLENFIGILTNPDFIGFYRNSVVTSASTTLLCLFISIHASYSFSRFTYRLNKTLQMGILATQMFPGIVLLLSLYMIYRKLGLLNTYLALILACTTKALPLSIWMLKGFFDTIPRSIEEAAYIDGAGKLATLYRIVTPLIKPGVVAVAIYSFMITWDDFIYALTLISSNARRTLPAGIALAFLGEYGYDWARVMAASVAASIPVLVVFIFLQKYMIAGLTAGAVKE